MEGLFYSSVLMGLICAEVTQLAGMCNAFDINNKHLWEQRFKEAGEDKWVIVCERVTN
jgi:hypothetical protein